MGSRGMESPSKRLPNFKHAEIARNKLKNYLLNPSKDENKARFFRSLGYNMRNFRRLERDIREGLKTAPAVATVENKYGHTVTAYSVSMPLGIDRKALVLTAWQRDANSTIPRLITAYPDKRGKKT